MNTFNTETFTFNLDAFLVAAQAKVDADYGHNINAHGEVMKAPVLSLENGKRYARIVATDSSSRSAFGFVDLGTGDVLKASSWKAPAKNFPRGNINDANQGCGRIRWTGVN